MNSNFDWTGFLKIVGRVNVVVSGIAAIFIFLTEEITNWPIIGLAVGLLIQAFFALGIIMTICDIHDRVADIKYYTNQVYSRVEKIG